MVAPLPCPLPCPPSLRSSSHSLLGPTPFSPQSTICLPTSLFLHVLLTSLSSSYKHFQPLTSPRLLHFAHSLITRQRSVIVLLAGASGTGKSTLASLLADRLRVDRVIGTDGVRHVLRSRAGGGEGGGGGGGETGGQQGVLHVSTYRAWDCVDDDADPALLTAEWGANGAGLDSRSTGDRRVDWGREEKEEKGGVGRRPQLPHSTRVLLGYHQQSALICSHLLALIQSLVASRTSAIIEGVHLLPAFLHFLSTRLSSSHTLFLPFLVFISNETKHRERFAVRSSHSCPPSLSAPLNPYVQHFPHIRLIQQHLLSQSQGALGAKGKAPVFPSIDNTNVDRSVAAVHAIALLYMARGEGGMDGGEEVVREVEGIRREAWGGKAMQRVLRQKVEKRHLFERLRQAERLRREKEEDDGVGTDGEGGPGVEEGEVEASEAELQPKRRSSADEEEELVLSEKLERRWLLPSSAPPLIPSSIAPPQSAFAAHTTEERGAAAVSSPSPPLTSASHLASSLAVSSTILTALSPLPIPGSAVPRSRSRLAGFPSSLRRPPVAPATSASAVVALSQLQPPALRGSGRRGERGRRRSSSPSPPLLLLTGSDEEVGAGAISGGWEEGSEGEGGGSVRSTSHWSRGGGSLVAASVDEAETGEEEDEEEGGGQGQTGGEEDGEEQEEYEQSDVDQGAGGAEEPPQAP